MIVYQSTAPIYQEAKQMNEEYPNLLIVNELPETPEEMIDSYLQMIIEHKDDPDELLSILQDFYNDISLQADKYHLINQAKLCLQQLEDINEFETYNYVDEDDE